MLQILYGKRDHTDLDLGVAVRAQKHTSCRLLAKRIQRERETAGTDTEALRRRIDVMELKRSDGPSVATNNAAPARLRHDKLL